MASTHRAQIRWQPEEDDVRAHTIDLAGQRLAASSAAEFGGNGEKADPEELFVAALSSCHMLWFLALAREQGFQVRSYEDDAEGVLERQRFVRVVLRPRVEFEGDVATEATVSLHHRSHELCFISNSVSCQVDVEPAVR